MKSNKPSNNGKPKKTDNSVKKQLRSVEQLKPYQFKKGQSGNPKGKPKGTISITSRIKVELQKHAKGSDKSYLDILIERILYKALQEGDKDMIKAIWSYVDGLPRQDITMEVIDKQSAREELESNFEVTPEGEVLKKN